MRKHSTANHDHNVNKLGYEMEVYIVIHDDARGLVASNRRVLDQMKLVQKTYGCTHTSNGRRILV